MQKQLQVKMHHPAESDIIIIVHMTALHVAKAVYEGTALLHTVLLTKTTAAQNEAALNYHRGRGLYFLAVVFVRRIVCNKAQFFRSI